MHQVDSGVVTNSSGHKVGSLALAKMIDQLVDKRSVSIFRQLWFRCKYVLYIFIIYQKTILLIICVFLAVLVCHYESSTFHTTLSFLRLRTFAARSALEISEALPKLRESGRQRICDWPSWEWRHLKKSLRGFDGWIYDMIFDVSWQDFFS